MRYESLILGIVVLAFGAYLVSSHGYLGGTYLPGLIGLPNPDTSGGNASFFPGIGGYSVGTVVALFGLGLIGNGVRSPSPPARSPGGSSAALPPEVSAALQQAMASRASMPAASSDATNVPGMHPGVAYCTKCGRANAHDAKFCQQCGGTIGAAP